MPHLILTGGCRTGNHDLGWLNSALLNLHVCRRGCSPCSNIRLGNLGTRSNRHQKIQLVFRKSRTVRLLQQCQKSFYLRSKCEWRVGVNLQLPTRHVTQRRCKKGGNTHLRHLSKGKLKCMSSLCNRGVTEFQSTEISNFI